MSHEPIGPRGPLAQLVDCLTHSTMAARSSALVSAVHAASIRVVNLGQEVRLEVGIKKMQIDWVEIRIWVLGQGWV